MGIIYIILILGGGDLVKELIDRNQYTAAILLAAVLGAVGLFLFWMESRSSETCDCDDDDPDYVTLSTEIVENLLNSAQAVQYGSTDITVSQDALEALQEDFEENRIIED